MREVGQVSGEGMAVVVMAPGFPTRPEASHNVSRCHSTPRMPWQLMMLLLDSKPSAVVSGLGVRNRLGSKVESVLKAPFLMG